MGESMEIVIRGEPKETADLVRRVQDRQDLEIDASLADEICKWLSQQKRDAGKSTIDV